MRSVSLKPEVPAASNDEQQDPAVDAYVQALRDEYRKDIGPDGMVTAGDIDGRTEQCKAESKVNLNGLNGEESGFIAHSFNGMYIFNVVNLRWLLRNCIPSNSPFFRIIFANI